MNENFWWKLKAGIERCDLHEQGCAEWRHLTLPSLYYFRSPATTTRLGQLHFLSTVSRFRAFHSPSLSIPTHFRLYVVQVRHTFVLVEPMTEETC